MQLKLLQKNDLLKENEFIIRSEKAGRLAIKIDLMQVHSRTKQLIINELEDFEENEDKKNYILNNENLLSSITDAEIQKLFHKLKEVFCTDKDELKHIKQNFYKFHNRFEQMTALLIYEEVERKLFSMYQKEMNL